MNQWLPVDTGAVNTIYYCYVPISVSGAIAVSCHKEAQGAATTLKLNATFMSICGDSSVASVAEHVFANQDQRVT